MKRFPKAALVTANVLMLIALACSNDVVGPVEAALANVRELISPEKDNALQVAEDGLLYVAQQSAGELVSEDSANVLRRGSDDLLFVPEGNGKVGPQGPPGEKGNEGPQGERGPAGPGGNGGLQMISRSVFSEGSQGEYPPQVSIDFPEVEIHDVYSFDCYASDNDTYWEPVVDCQAQGGFGDGVSVRSAVSGFEAAFNFKVVLVGNFDS